MVEWAALAYAGATAFAVLFQAALACGAPWGEYAMAGRFPGRLPWPMRILAIVQAVTLVFLAGLVLQSSALWVPPSAFPFPKAIWGVVAIAFLSVAANAATPSAKERRLWLPVTLVLLGSSLMVGVGSL